MLKLGKKTIGIALFIILFQNVYSLQFGNGNDLSTTTFVKVADEVIDFDLEFYTTYLLKKDNSLWGTGLYVNRDFYNIKEITKSFIKVQENVLSFDGLFLKKTDGSIYQISKGLSKENAKIKKSSGPFYITEDNTLWVSGKNTTGSYGTGSFSVNYEKPVKVRENVIDVWYSSLFSLIITDKHELMISGTHYLPSPYRKNNVFEKIADNVRFTIGNFYITEDDELYAFGWAAMGITGLGDLGNIWKLLPTKVMDDVKSVACNGQATLILKNDGTLFGCGGESPNYCGELGLGNYDTIYKPQFIMNDVLKIDMGSTYAAVLKKDGSFWMCGANTDTQGGL